MFLSSVRFGQPFLLHRPPITHDGHATTAVPAIRFSGTQEAQAKLELSDSYLFNRLPKPAQIWLKKGVIGKFDPAKPMPLLGFEQLLRGMLRVGAQAATNITDFDADPWPGKPHEVATLAPLMRYLHDTDELEDEEPRRETIWEILTNSASNIAEGIREREQKDPPKELGIRFTPDLRRFLEHYVQKASSLIPTTEEFFQALTRPPSKKSKSSSPNEGWEYFRGSLAAVRSQYEEMTANYIAPMNVDDDDDDDKIEVADAKTTAEATDTMDADELKALKKSPFGAKYLRWYEKVRALEKLPAAERDFTPRQLEELKDTLARFRTAMPEEVGESVRESFSMQLNQTEALLELPWEKPAIKPIDLKKVRTTLDADHYGMEDPKMRVMKYMATQQRRQNHGLPKEGKIMLLLGDPGVGKTSLAGSIAKSLDVPMMPVALGGIKEVAEIRGDRRVFTESRPGIFIRSISEAGVKNPVILLDELEKIQDRGVKDALLEVLDPKQNKRFRDHFVGEYDLSQAFFIGTANSLTGIPAPLMRRLEIIPLRPYTVAEKLKIATLHLLPKIMEKNVLSPAEFQISEETLLAIVDKYAPESGVSLLEKRINLLAESRVYELSQGETPPPEITSSMLQKYFNYEPRMYKVQSARVGRVNALDSSGAGALTPIDVTVTPYSVGKNRPSMLKLESMTGGLGRMERDSVQKMLGYVKSHAAEIAKLLGIESLIKSGTSYTVNVDDGGEYQCGPTDGPSAGITFTTGLVSALSALPVRGDVAMTGTTSLHGDVGAIGGLLNKLMGSVRSGAKVILAPRSNLSEDNKYVLEGGDRLPIPPEVLEKVKIIPIQHFNEAIPHLFERPEVVKPNA